MIRGVEELVPDNNLAATCNAEDVCKRVERSANAGDKQTTTITELFWKARMDWLNMPLLALRASVVESPGIGKSALTAVLFCVFLQMEPIAVYLLQK